MKDHRNTEGLLSNVLLAAARGEFHAEKHKQYVQRQAETSQVEGERRQTEADKQTETKTVKETEV